MKRPISRFIFMGAVAAAPALRAQLLPPPIDSSQEDTSAAPATPAAPAPAAPAPAPAPSAQAKKPEAPPATALSVSPDVAAMLAAQMPRYEPPKPPSKTPEDQLPDLRDIDKPKNEIIRLPAMVVHPETSPVFRDKDLYSKDDMGELNMLKYPGLYLGPGAYLNTWIANQMAADEERGQNMADLKDTAQAMAAGGDNKEGEDILKASDETYMRHPDFGGNVTPSATNDFASPSENQ